MTPKLRDRVLAEWRGLRQTPPRPDRARPVSELLEKVMRGLGLTERLTESQIIDAWQEIVGDFIASHAAPSRLSKGILYIQVLQPTVHYELDRVWKPEIVKKLKARFGAKVIREVKFRVG